MLSILLSIYTILSVDTKTRVQGQEINLRGPRQGLSRLGFKVSLKKE